MSQAYIIDAVRTATGRRKGALAGWHPADLGAASIDALLARTGIDPAAVDDVIFGCVTQGGEQSFAAARNVVLASALPETVPAVTIDRQCGSAQQARAFCRPGGDVGYAGPGDRRRGGEHDAACRCSPT